MKERGYAHKRDEKIIEAGARIGGVFFRCEWFVASFVANRRLKKPIWHKVKRLLFNAVCGRICGKVA